MFHVKLQAGEVLVSNKRGSEGHAILIFLPDEPHDVTSSESRDTDIFSSVVAVYD